MAVSYQPTSLVAKNASDNTCRWDGKTSPHYEVWFLTLNHRASQTGFWFRYTIESSVSSELQLAPTASMWAAWFSRSAPDKNFGVKSEYPIERFEADQDAFNIKIAESQFSSSRAAGRVESGGHTIEWDLNYKPCNETYQHVSRALIRLARPSSFVCSPNLDTRFSGTIAVDGKVIMLQDEPGCQSHLWGRKHVDDWVWVHSNAFENHPGSVFEGLAARPRRGGQMLPPIQSLYLRHRDQEHRFVRLRFAEQWQRKLGMGYWSFSAMNTGMYIEGAAQCRLRDMLQAEYVDPDGEKLFCINSEVANLKIRLFKRVHGLSWRHVETIKSYGSAHLEHASRARDDRVMLAFEENAPVELL